MAKVFYEDIEIGVILTNSTLTIDEALDLIQFNEQAFLEEQGWDELNPSDFTISYE
jgi:hypothetical protein